MEESFFKFVWKHSKKQQLWILTIVLLSFPFYFALLNLPKQIVNGPIQGEWFPLGNETIRLFSLKWDDIGLGAIGDGFILQGMILDREGSLWALSLVFLALIAISGGFKFYINTYKGQLGERMLRRLRYMLVDQLMRFPLPQYKKINAAETASMVKDEVEPLGGFIGDAYVQPMFLAGQAVTIMIFIIAQNIWLGLIALGIVLLQASLIPRLRRVLLGLMRRRQVAARHLAGKVGALVDGAVEMRVNDATNYERASLSSQLGELFFIRRSIFFYKFLIKYANNTISQLAPFLFYLVGGLFAVAGQLDIGQLIAVIAAYKDLPSPIKELIDWDQQRLVAQLRYAQVVEQFAVKGVAGAEQQKPATIPVTALQTPVTVERLALQSATGEALIRDLQFSVATGEQVCVVDPGLSCGAEIARALARVASVEAGDIRFDRQSLFHTQENAVGRRIAFVDETPYLQAGTLRNCLLYSVRHARPPNADGREPGVADEEAQLSGNSTLTMDDDWFDLDVLGLDSAADLDAALLELLDHVDLSADVFEMGLTEPMRAEDDSALKSQILAARRAMRDILDRDTTLGSLIERFDASRYQQENTIGENLLFGAPKDRSQFFARLSKRDTFWQQLRDVGLAEPLTEIGRGIAQTAVDLFSDLPENHPFYERLPFISANDLPDLRNFLTQAPTGGPAMTAADPASVKFLRLALHYVEPRYRFGLLSLETREAVVRARQALRDFVTQVYADDVDFWNEEALLPGISLEENIIFGRVTEDTVSARERVREEVTRLIETSGARAAVLHQGLRFEVGAGGRRLTPMQQQKTALARAVLKRPNLFVVNNATSTLDPEAARRLTIRLVSIARQGWRGRPFASVWALRDANLCDVFDTTLHLENGRISGTHAPASEKSGGVSE